MTARKFHIDSHHAPALPGRMGAAGCVAPPPTAPAAPPYICVTTAMTPRRSRLPPGPRRPVRRRRRGRPLIEADLDEDEDVEIGAGDPDRDTGSPANRA